MRRGVFGVLLLCFSGACCTGRQELRLLEHSVQLHAFASQGFTYTNGNDWLKMNAAKGSGPDMGINAMSQINDKFRIGAQIYDRNLGQLGQWHPTLDWAVADHSLDRLVWNSGRQSQDQARTVQRFPGFGFPAGIRSSVQDGNWELDSLLTVLKAS